MLVTIAYAIGAIVGLALFGAEGIAGGLLAAFLFIVFSGVTSRIVNGGVLPRQWRMETAQAFMNANRRTIAVTFPETSDALVLAAIEKHIETILTQVLRDSSSLDLETAATPSAIHTATLTVAGRTKDPRLNLLFADLSLHLKAAFR